MGCPTIAPATGRRLPQPGSLVPPVWLSDITLVRALVAASADLARAASAPGRFQRRHARFLHRAAWVLSAVFEFLSDSSSSSSRSFPNTCFRELYVVVLRAKLLLEFCRGSSTLWLLVNVCHVAAQFNDVAKEMGTLLDVLPAKELALEEDLLEQVELLRLQSCRLGPAVDPHDEALRRRVAAFLDGFCHGQPPDPTALRRIFVDDLAIPDAMSFRAEIEFLEERLHSLDDGLDDAAHVQAVIAIARYTRFAVFGLGSGAAVPAGAGQEAEIVPPKEFCCPVSLDLMRDPVIVATGQTYDRASISQWLADGHRTCPTSGLPLVHTQLVPNRALRNLISHWCAAAGLPYDPPLGPDTPLPPAAAAANRATAQLLVKHLGRPSEVTESARELRALARAGPENRRYVAEAGAVPALKCVLCSPEPAAQAHAVTAILNLSLLDSNRGLIVGEPGCVRAVVAVCAYGLTVEARENAAAVLFSLSAVHNYKALIASEEGALHSLGVILREGTAGGKKDAVAALFNICTHAGAWEGMVKSGAAEALVAALGDGTVAEEAAAALAVLARQPEGAAALAGERRAVNGLLGLMRRGTPRGKENAVAALLEICRGGGAAAAERVARAPAMGSLVQTILFTGTKRARRKAASLVRLCRRSAGPAQFTTGWAPPLSVADYGSMLDSSAVVPAT